MPLINKELQDCVLPVASLQTLPRTTWITTKPLLRTGIPKAFLTPFPEAFSLVNGDDRNGQIMIQNSRSQKFTYACKRMANFTARVLEQNAEGMHLVIDGIQVWSPLIGMHNAYNLLSVYACARLLNQPADEILRILSSLKTVSGRMEYVKEATT